MTKKKSMGFSETPAGKQTCAVYLPQACVYGAHAYLETLLQDTPCASRTWITSFNFISKVNMLASPYPLKTNQLNGI